MKRAELERIGETQHGDAPKSGELKRQAAFRWSGDEAQARRVQEEQAHHYLGWIFFAAVREQGRAQIKVRGLTPHIRCIAICAGNAQFGNSSNAHGGAQQSCLFGFVAITSCADNLLRNQSLALQPELMRMSIDDIADGQRINCNGVNGTVIGKRRTRNRHFLLVKMDNGFTLKLNAPKRNNYRADDPHTTASAEAAIEAQRHR